MHSGGKKPLFLSWNVRIMQFCLLHLKRVLTGSLILDSLEISPWDRYLNTGGVVGKVIPESQIDRYGE